MYDSESNSDKFTSRKLVLKEGEWLERYIEVFLKLSGFKTIRNLRINMDKRNYSDITHEFDVVAKLNGIRPIYVECKDVNYFNKSLVDAFVGKLTDVDWSGAILVTSNLSQNSLIRYKNYCDRKCITFFDGNTIDYFLEDIASKETNLERQQFIADKLGIQLPDENRSIFLRIFNWFKRRLIKTNNY